MSERLDLSHYLPYLLNRTVSRIAISFTQIVRDFGITLPVWRALAALHYQDGQSVSQLSHMTSIEISTLSRVLDLMQTKSLVVRNRPAADARRVTVHLTAAGRELTERIVPIARRYETLALDGFSEAEAAEMKAMLLRLNANLQRMEEERETRKAG